jgi:hypothetical protein
MACSSGKKKSFFFVLLLTWAHRPLRHTSGSSPPAPSGPQAPRTAWSAQATCKGRKPNKQTSKNKNKKKKEKEKKTIVTTGGASGLFTHFAPVLLNYFYLYFFLLSLPHLSMSSMVISGSMSVAGSTSRQLCTSNAPAAPGEQGMTKSFMMLLSSRDGALTCTEQDGKK